jgi:hypothetical protein
MLFLKTSLAALLLLGAASATLAETVQDSRGTFIQDRSGVWHRYVLARPSKGIAAVYNSRAEYDDIRSLMGSDAQINGLSDR